LAQVDDVLMTFYTPELILGQITTHCALKDVSQKITAKRLRKAVTLMHEGLINVFNYDQPRIEVLGLNPHAGENGTIGIEEVDLIIPTLDALRQEGYPVTGPVSGDTAFIPPRLAQVDAILAMYHDQGLGPLKALFFGQIVNITLGLPFLRTSVDHGTALDIAGTLKGSVTSLIFAIEACANFAFTHEKTRMTFTNSVQPA
jgi:4-hydroxythreonine-4-phosphate dehydrogenase